MSSTQMHKFTVLLVRPDWCADGYGTDTMVCYVEVPSHEADAAAQQARKELWEQDNSGPDGMSDQPQGDPSDYFCAAVFSGWQSNVYAG